MERQALNDGLVSDFKLLYVLVDKQVNTRFFEVSNSGPVNVAAGTLVDNIVAGRTEPGFDFYMVPHKATVATALPVHYEVAINSTGMNDAAVQDLIHQQCYGYYNYVGPIKVPASVMLANKICNYAHDIGKDKKARFIPSDKLSTKLHFL